MTIRDLLSSYDKNAVVRIHIFDLDYNSKELNVCFQPLPGREWLYVDDLEELDELADRKINRWYIHFETIRIQIDGKL